MGADACSSTWEDCRSSKCCSDAALTCFEKDQWWAECKASCIPGIHDDDAPQWRTPWSCIPLEDGQTTTTTTRSVCAGVDESCETSMCCSDSALTCFEKDQWWAECKATCEPGIHMDDAPQWRT